MIGESNVAEERYCKKCGCRCHCYAPECPDCANDVCYNCGCKEDDISTWGYDIRYDNIV